MPDIRIVPNSAGMAFTSSLNYTETITQTASGSLVLYGSGSLGRTEIFAVDGANGRLFEVTDDFSNSLFSVNTIAGVPVMEAFATNQVIMGSYGNNFSLGIGSNTVTEGTGVSSAIQMFVSSSYGGGPLIQLGPNGRIRPGSTGDRLELEGNALYLNRAFGSSIIVGGTMSMQTNNVTFTNTTSTGIQDASGTAWFRPRDTSNNLHIRTSSGGIYLDTDGTHYFRNVAGTNRGYMDGTNGGGRFMDTTAYSYAANMNQNVRTTDSPTFSSLTLSGNLTLSSGYISGYVGGSGSGDSYAPFRFSQDYSGWMVHVAGTPGSNNGWGLFWAGNSGAQYGTNGTGGPGDIWTNSTNPNEYVFVGNGSTNMSIHGNTGNVWIAGGVSIGGSMTRGTYTSASNYVTGADNLVLKGNSSGVSGIFFESEKDNTNINHPSDFGFIQFHSYGIGGSSGEANRLVIGASNDADDLIVLNPMDTNGVKVRIGAGTTEYTVKHLGNTTYATSFSSVSSVTVTHNLGTKDVMVMCYDSNDEMFWPSSIVTTSTSVVTITFAATRSGRVVVLR